MSNFTPTGAPVRDSAGSSAAIRNEFVAVQTAVNSKADSASPTLTGTLTVPHVVASTDLTIGATLITATGAELNKLAGATVTAAELNKLAGTPAGLTSAELGYVDGVTSAIQGQLNGKVPVTSTTTTTISATGINADIIATANRDISLICNNNVALAGINVSLNGDTLSLFASNGAPASASDTGVVGELRFDANYIYRCTATNTWKRSALTTW